MSPVMKKCILCENEYEAKSIKSKLCKKCWAEEYWPNRHLYSLSDIECGLYSLITKRYHENFWGKRIVHQEVSVAQPPLEHVEKGNEKFDWNKDHSVTPAKSTEPCAMVKVLIQKMEEAKLQRM